jgi:penicillin-binding protein 2
MRALYEKNFSINGIQRKIRFFYWIISLGFLAVFLRVFFLQILNYSKYQNLLNENSMRFFPKQAARGIITCRHGQILATNKPSFSLFLVPAQLKSTSSTLVQLSEILGESLDSLEDMVALRSIDRRYEPILLQSHLTASLIAKIEENQERLPGVYIHVEPERYYPYGKLASHVLGYIGQISQQELLDLKGEGYQYGNWMGQKGIEKFYDQYLRGENGGTYVEVNAQGIQQKVLYQISSSPGDTAVLTLDMKLQRIADQLLKGKEGAVIVSNPRNGQILALASHPNFNPNDFVGGISVKNWKHLIDNPEHPLENKAIQNGYPPGSVFKLVVSQAALADRVVTPSQLFLCRGIFWYDSWPYRCWDIYGHGWISMHNALVESCDIYFYQVGLKLKISRIYQMARRMGLGSLTGIDLSSEGMGLVPNPRWKEAVLREPWFPGNTIQLSIGQGYLLTTPIQMLDVISEIAENGKVYRPHLLLKIVDPKTKQVVFKYKKTVLLRTKIPKNIINFVKSAMCDVVNSSYGTGVYARIPGVEVAGKTGTAETPHHEKSDGWFVAIAPAQHPKVAVVVMIEHGGEGGLCAAPIAKKLIEAALGYTTTNRRMGSKLNLEKHP